MSEGTTLIDRIGYDARFIRLEETLVNSASHGFQYLHFNAGIGHNRRGPLG